MVVMKNWTKDHNFDDLSKINLSLLEGNKIKPREKAPKMFAMQLPITFPIARDGWWFNTEETTTASWEDVERRDAE